MDVGGWLRSLGLGQYEAALHDNAIDAEVLRELTADDLKDLGVSLIAHRRKLLAAIAASRPSPPSSGAPTEPRPEEGAGLGASAAERGHLTVMFCDLVGSAALSAWLRGVIICQQRPLARGPPVRLGSSAPPTDGRESPPAIQTSRRDGRTKTARDAGASADAPAPTKVG
jgi:hypothetical protein